MVFGSDGGIQYTSPSVKRVLGYMPDELAGKMILDFVYNTDRDNVAFMYSGKPKEPDAFVEFRFRRRDGVWRMLQAFWKNTADEAGNFKAIVNAWDITDRIREQEALRESIIRHLKEQTELHKTQEQAIARERLGAIGQMASGIAHDFSNALMPILGFCEILLKRPENLDDKEKLKKYLGVINTSACDAMKIVARLREFYRKKEKTESLNFINLNTVLEETITMTQHKWKTEALAHGAMINVRTDFQPLPNIVGNETAIREALTNLIFNSVDAMPGGGELCFTTRLEGTQVRLDVKDNGVGMDENTQKHCFEPFFSTKGRAGTGLGLAMVYGIVSRHEGSIEIQSHSGQGTNFIIRLPIGDTRELVFDKDGNIASAVLKPARNLSLLLVDDEPMVLEVMTEYLSGDGHIITTAVDGKEGLEKFKAGKFDLVLTDRAMPQMNGDQLAEKIKQLSPQTPVIMVTGFGELMKAKGEQPKGVDIVLSKPLKIEAARQAIAQAMAAARPETGNP
jgi:PAS domain S-box-containing protein